MRNAIKILIICAVISPILLSAHDGSLHMFIGSQTSDIWQNYDPAFYNALVNAQSTWENSADVQKLSLLKFYYIGLTFPDMLWPHAQGMIRGLIAKLYETGGLTGPFDITATTYNLVQTEIEFSYGDNSHNLEKLYQMVNYARSQNWPPAEKALIYGAFMHVVHDLYGHTALQSARFSYGKCYDSDSALHQNILRYGELYHELFSQTHITNWFKFIIPLYCSVDWTTPEIPVFREDAFGFYRQINVDPVEWKVWQELDFDPVQKFVDASNAVGWSIQNLTQDRLETYPGAARSLEEGMNETLMVVDLGLPPAVRQSLQTTNLLESAFSVVRQVSWNVKRWRNGSMAERWAVLGLIEAEKRFRKIKGYRDLPLLVKALQTRKMAHKSAVA